MKVAPRLEAGILVVFLAQVKNTEFNVFCCPFDTTAL